MADDVVLIEGLDELRLGLRQASRELPKALTRAHQIIAKQVATAARGSAVTRNGKPTPSSKTIRGSGTQRGASVVASGVTVFGDEFGGGAKPTTRQFRPHLGRVGYAIYPAIRKLRPVIDAELLDMIVAEIEKKGFPD